MPTLGRYLSNIYDGNKEDGKADIEGLYRLKQNPQLCRERSNVILTYRGSFNPPHRGHLAVLWCAFHQLSERLNIVAAYIRICPDRSLEKKYRNRKGARLFSSEERARLWKEDPDFPPWAWIYEDSEDGPSALQAKLKALARADRCRIRFAELYGPDCYDQANLREMTIVTDVAREAPFDSPYGLQICHWLSFGSWLVDDGENKTPAPTRVQVQMEHDKIQRERKETIEKEREEVRKQQRIAAGEAQARRAVEEKYSSVLDISASLLHGVSHLAIAKVDGLLGLEDPNTTPVAPVRTQPKESLTTQLNTLRSPQSVSVCWQTQERPIKSLRFLRSTPEQHAPFRGISSTVIQEKMQELKGYKLKAVLESMVLSPGLLWDMLLPSRLRCDKVAYTDSKVDGPICLDIEMDLIARHSCPNHPPLHPTTARTPICHWHTLSYHRGTQTLDDMLLPVCESLCHHPPKTNTLTENSRNSPPIINSTAEGTKRKRDIFDDGVEEHLPKKRTIIPKSNRVPKPMCCLNKAARYWR
ncbi:MAG: hypothetical protein Q9182_003227 [Xanthomendoza sp. 2 TL-2023]